MNTYKVRVREDNEKQYSVAVHADSAVVDRDTGYLTFYTTSNTRNYMGTVVNNVVAVFTNYVYMKKIVSEEP